MPIRPFVAGESFDPETLEILTKAFQGACTDLGVTDKRSTSRAEVAKQVIALADGQRDPETIRAAVVAFSQGHKPATLVSAQS